MRKVTAKVSTEPVAYVTKGKQRIKQYKTANDPNYGTVYLNNGEEFELELFNPTSNKVLAKIELNGNSIGAGIVLRPGERVFIERYLDEARKFMFQTYEVNGNNEEVKRAIAKNGSVKVLFYKEQIPLTYWGSTTWTTHWPTWYGGGTYTSNIGSPSFGGSDVTLDGISDSHCFYSNSMSTPTSSFDSGTLDFMDQNLSRGIVSNSARGSSSGRKMSKSANLSGSLRSKSVETGMIDKGSHSNQTFAHDYSSFETYWTWKTEWKILPTSQKPIISEDIKVFCTNCGAKQKKSSHKFCPHCGEQY